MMKFILGSRKSPPGTLGFPGQPANVARAVLYGTFLTVAEKSAGKQRARGLVTLGTARRQAVRIGGMA